VYVFGGLLFIGKQKATVAVGYYYLVQKHLLRNIRKKMEYYRNQIRRFPDLYGLCRRGRHA
jgi:hypothetical protein